MKPILSVKDLTIKFQSKNSLITAVDSLSFEIQKGQALGIIGESGSGKSVTSLAIMRLLPTSAKVCSGNILFADRDLLSIKETEINKIRGNHITMIFQEPMSALNPFVKVGKQISELLIHHKSLSKKEAWSESIELINAVEVPQAELKAHQFPHELSGGQKQRIMIAMAVACKPELIIADEPTTALDVNVQNQILKLLKKLQQKHQLTMIFISHDLKIISEIADDILVMRNSKMVEYGDSQQILNNPNHAYTKALLACRPKLQNNPERLLTINDFINDSDAEINECRLLKTGPKSKTISKIPLVEVKGLTVNFTNKTGLFGRNISQIKAVNNISFEIKRGETLGIVGESGSGKTTLVKALLALQKVESGQVIFDGQNLMTMDSDSLRSYRSRMQIVFQDPMASLNPKMTIFEIISEPIVIHKPEIKNQQRLLMAQSLIEKVGLDRSCLNQYPHEFSGGQRQRICIARAISIKPDLIICDESVSALDVSIQATILNLLKDLQDEFRLTYLFISHDLAVINSISDRVGVLYKGNMVEIDTVENIYNNPQHSYTKSLLNLAQN